MMRALLPLPQGSSDSSDMLMVCRGSSPQFNRYQVKSPAEQLKVGVIGGGLAGLITAMDLADAGHKVEIFEARRFVGGKVGSWVDKDVNHIEMGLHVFFGCYYNLFGIFKRLGIFEKSLRLKEHTHSFINRGEEEGMKAHTICT